MNTRCRESPNLDDLVVHPEQASELPLDAAQALLTLCSERILRLSAVRDSLMLAVASSLGAARHDADRFLDVSGVAAKICKSVSWIQKNGNQLPARRRIGGEALWSEREVEAWMRSCPRWGDD